MKHSTDELMIRLYRSLWNDMRHATKTSCGNVPRPWSIRQAREYTMLLHDNLTPYQYKWGAQMNSFLKRYVFRNDVITPSERENLTNAKFLKLQSDLAQVYWRQRSMRLHKVLCRARSICTRILSGIEPETVTARGQFGSKATVGCPASQAYIDEKLLTRPITGSSQHADWAKSQLIGVDPLLQEIVDPARIELCSALPQVNVPKKYNIDRGINPNTLLGSYYTSSLGRQVEIALSNEGLDIRRQQVRHGILARRASTNRKLVTADLSDASHGFLSHILNALMPRKWYRALMYGAIRQVEVDGRVYRLESIMTMGIGFTFPVQTLLFYCLLKALAELLDIKGLISVYGDDLIYPRKLHPYVVATFSELGFKLNLDKTYVESHFRESCGSDYYRGVNVRPFAPEGISSHLSKTEYAAFCYKLLNGLLTRWDAHEIERTVFLLKFEVCQVMGQLFVVPKHFPDHSGWKYAANEYASVHCTSNWWLFPIAPWRWNSLCQKYDFPHIIQKPDRHFVRSQSPFYWNKLRSLATRDPEQVVPILSLPDYIGEPLFRWRRKRLRYRGKSSKHLVPTVASKSQLDGTYRITT